MPVGEVAMHAAGTSAASATAPDKPKIIPWRSCTRESYAERNHEDSHKVPVPDQPDEGAGAAGAA